MIGHIETRRPMANDNNWRQEGHRRKQKEVLALQAIRILEGDMIGPE
jgi:hypothetical protein